MFRNHGLMNTLFLQILIDYFDWTKMVFLQEIWISLVLRLIWDGWAEISIVDTKSFFVVSVAVFALFVNGSWSEDNVFLEYIRHFREIRKFHI